MDAPPSQNTLIDLSSPRAIRLMFWVGAAAFCFGVFIKLTLELREDDHVGSLDRVILVWVARFRHDILNGSAVDLTALGSATVVFLVTVIACVFLWLADDRKGVVHLAVASSGAGIWSTLAKHVIERARPEIVPRLVEVSGYSYPSGHSLSAASLYLTLAIIACRRFPTIRARLVIFALALGLIGSVGFSRIYLGVHYPSDTVSGIFLGSAWALFLAGIVSVLHTKQDHHTIQES